MHKLTNIEDSDCYVIKQEKKTIEMNNVQLDRNNNIPIQIHRAVIAQESHKIRNISRLNFNSTLVIWKQS